jgi:DNA adenine methylase
MVKYCCEKCGHINKLVEPIDDTSTSSLHSITDNAINDIRQVLNGAMSDIEDKLDNLELLLAKQLQLSQPIHKIEGTIKNVSPLRYPGGKTRACKPLNDILQQHFDMDKYDTVISPFFGGGSFEFFLQNNYNVHILANDKFRPLYSFWKSCKTDKEELVESLDEFIDTVDKSYFGQLRENIIEEVNTLEQGVMYFLINRCSFSGATMSGGFSLESSKKRFTPSSIKKIRDLDLSYFDIYNLDFVEFIQHHTNENRRNPIMFLDPPYFLEKGSKLYGSNGDMHEHFDHDKLYECVSRKKNWFMTYNNCEYIKNLYKDFTIIETGWSYGMNKSKESSEIVIIG